MSKIATTQENELVGSRLAEVRASTRLAQGEFAERIGVSPRAYQNYERGEREAPISVLRRVCETYGSDMAWLLSGIADKSPNVRAVVNAELLGQLILEVNARLRKARRRLPDDTKAKMIALLYTHFSNNSNLDMAHIDEMLELVA